MLPGQPARSVRASGIPGQDRAGRRSASGSPRSPARIPARVCAAHDAPATSARAAIALEALEVEAERRGARPQVRIVGVRRILEERVVELPEAALARRPPRRRRRAAPRAGCLAAIAKWRKATPQRRAAQPRVGQRAARAGVVAVEDRRAARCGSPRTWSAAPSAGAGRCAGRSQRSRLAAAPSAPPAARGVAAATGVEPVEDQVGAGQLAGRRRLVAPAHDARRGRR